MNWPYERANNESSEDSARRVWLIRDMHTDTNTQTHLNACITMGLRARIKINGE